MHSFDVLSSETQILGAHVLEASAGTGKTFAIEHLVVRLLLQEEKEIDLDQMLIVTFTRAATRELRSRIRNNLQQAIDGLLTGDGASYLISITKKEEAVRKIKRALSAFEESSIFTIHGFCHRMLKLFAFEANISFNTSDPDDREYQGIMRAHVHDFFRTSLHEGIYTAEQLEIVLKKFKNDTFHLEQALIRAMEGGCTPEVGAACDSLEAPQLLLRMAKHCKYNWENKKLRDHLSPDEILKKMQESLQNPHFAQRVAKKYQAVIIDEFQDTDPIQWAIFEHLFTAVSQPAAFYLVGDPKQSIYGFRSADIYTYLRAVDKIGNVSFLDTNYRSLPSLVSALNVFFESAPWITLPKTQENLSFHPVKAKSTEEGGRLHFFIAQGLATREKKWPSTQLEEEQLFPYIAHTCQEYQGKTIAVLVKDRFQAERIHLYFQKSGISSVVKQGFDLKESSEFQAFYTILKAVNTPRSLSSLRKALVTSLIGWTATDLGDEERLQQAKRQFLEYKELWESQGFSFFVRQWIEDHAIEMTLPLRQLLELLLSSSEPFFLMQEMIQSEEKISLRLEENLGDIVIMTTHMSKGLEFDVVFALGLASRHMAQEEFMKTDRGLVLFGEDSLETVLVEKEQEAEKLRNLYVALTRAKISLYVPVIIDTQGKNGERSPIELFLEKALSGKITQEKLITFIEKFATYTVINHAIERIYKEPPAVREETVREIPKWYPKEEILSFSALAQKSAEHSFSPVEAVIPLGSETGTLVHACFEKILENSGHHPFQEKKCKQVIARVCKSTPLEGLHEAIFEMVHAALHKELDGFMLSQVPAEQMLLEMEFLYPLNGNMMKGFVDLCFVWEGKYYFLDWKTNYLENYGKEFLVKAMEEQDYFLQAKLYSEALKRYVKLFDMPVEFGGAFYYFLRGQAVYHFFPA